MSDAAYLALRTLRERPYLDTPELICTGPVAVKEIDAEAIEAGLHELEKQGLAERRESGWILTETGSQQI